MLDRFVDDLVVVDLTNEERFSFSKLTTYENCPYEWLLHYKFGERGSDNAFARAGSVAHELIDDYWRGKVSEFELPQEFENRWQEQFEDEGWSIRVFGRDVTEKTKNDFANYFSDVSLPDGWKVLESEKQYTMIFKHKGESIMLTGILDLLAEDENGDLIVIDNKSKAGFKNDAEKSEYLRQLYLYSLFIRERFGKFPKKLCFNLMRLPKNKRFVIEEFEEEAMWEIVKWIFKTTKDIKGEFLWEPKPNNFYCHSLCGQRYNCRFGPLYNEEEEDE